MWAGYAHRPETASGRRQLSKHTLSHLDIGCHWRLYLRCPYINRERDEGVVTSKP